MFPHNQRFCVLGIQCCDINPDRISHFVTSAAHPIPLCSTAVDEGPAHCPAPPGLRAAVAERWPEAKPQTSCRRGAQGLHDLGPHMCTLVNFAESSMIGDCVAIDSIPEQQSGSTPAWRGWVFVHHNRLLSQTTLRAGSWGTARRRSHATIDIDDCSLFGRLTRPDAKLSGRSLDRDSACGWGMRPTQPPIQA